MKKGVGAPRTSFLPCISPSFSLSDDIALLPERSGMAVFPWALTCVFIVVVGAQNVLLCGRNDAPKPGSYARIQSPDFPKTIKDENGAVNCESWFVPTAANTHLWLSLTNALTPGLTLKDGTDGDSKYFKSVDTNKGIFTFYATSGTTHFHVSASVIQFPPDWTAFDGLIVATLPEQKCPFSGQTIALTDGGTLIPITSSLNDVMTTHFASSSCAWTFTVDSSKYRLKVVTRFLQFTPAETLTLSVDGGAAQDFSTAVEVGDEKAKYFSGSRFDFSYSSDGQQRAAKGFYAVVSAVPQNPTLAPGKCNTNSSGDVTYFGNFDVVNNYGSAQQCSLNAAIPASSELSISVTSVVEKCCDQLTLSTANIKNMVIEDGTFIVTAPGSQYSLQWQSDGNTQQAGFQTTITSISCECVANKQVQTNCTGSVVVGPTGTSNTHYCSNADCTVRVVPNPQCSQLYYQVTPYARTRDGSIDEYDVVVDDRTVYRATATDNSLPLRYVRISPKAVVTTRLRSGPPSSVVSVGDQDVALLVKMVPGPAFKRVVLTAQQPSFAFALGSLTPDFAISVCVDGGVDSAKLQMFASDDSTGLGNTKYIALYDASDLRFFVSMISDLPTDPAGSPTLYTSHSGCLTVSIARNVSTGGSLFFRIQPATPTNCLQSDVLNGDPLFSGANTTLAASAKGACEVTVLGTQYAVSLFGISAVSFTGSTDNVVLKPSGTTRTFLKFSASDHLAPLDLFAVALTIVVPAGGQLRLNLRSYDGSSTAQNVVAYYDEFTRRGVFASPSFAGLTVPYPTQTELYRIVTVTLAPVNFTVQQLDLGPQGSVSVALKSTHHTFTPGEHFSALMEDIHIIYTDPQPSENGFLIEYTVQSNNIDGGGGGGGNNGGCVFAYPPVLLLISLFFAKFCGF